jgi:hypothetical protein
MSRPDGSQITHFQSSPPSSATFFVDTADSVDIAFMVYPDGTFATQTFEANWGVGGHASGTHALNPNYPYYALQGRSVDGATHGPVTVRMCFTGQETTTPAPPPVLVPPTNLPAPPAAPTCGTYQDICNFLNTLATRLTGIESALEILLRRQRTVTYKTVNVTNNITNSGTLTVSGIPAIRVSLTTVPIAYGGNAGNPPTIYEAGFVTPGTDTEWFASIPIRHTPTIVAPLPAGTTRIGYEWHPGIVARIEQLTYPK